MTKLRAHLPLVACAAALALSAATASAASFSELQGITTEVEPVELPSPPRPPSGTMSINGDYSLDGPAPRPKIANAPRPGPQSPLRIQKRIDKSSPLLAK